MAEYVYNKLQKRFNMLPTSFPETKEGYEIRILKILFSEEEAEIASLLPLMGKEEPVSVKKLAADLGRPEAEFSQKVEAMAKKGMVILKGDQDSPVASLLPFMPGIYEFSYHRMDRELAELLMVYMKKYVYKAAGSSGRELGRVVPPLNSVSPNSTMLPYEDIAQIIEASSSIAVTPCICRTKTKLLDKGCHFPTETCMYFNDYADYLNRVGLGRTLTKQEALDLFRKTEEMGLIHLSTNIQETAVICNCCDSCCEGTKALIWAAKNGRMELGPVMNFRVAIDSDSCSACGLCIERCKTEVLSFEGDTIVLNKEKCVGCGLCVTTCPTGALCLERKPDAETKSSPRDWSELFSEMSGS